MRKLVIEDTHTDNTLVFVRYSDTVDVYIESTNRKVNDYMEDFEVIQSYSFQDFRRLFPEIAEVLLDEV